MDRFSFDETSQELYVIDDFGMHILFDCALDDLLHLDEELLKLGTFFIKKNEAELDLRSHAFPLVDRF
jgi:hypothetical protein